MAFATGTNVDMGVEQITYYRCGLCGYSHFEGDFDFVFHSMFGGAERVLVLVEMTPQGIADAIRIDLQKRREAKIRKSVSGSLKAA